MDKLVPLMSWLCCVKRKNRYAEKMEDELDTSVPVGTGQGGYQPTFLAAPYHPEYFESGYFESDCDDDDDEDIEGDSIDRDDGEDPNDEKFNFPFHDSIFRFPQKDYDEIWGTRRPTKRKTRDKKKVENNDKIGKVSTWDQVYKCKKKKEDAILEDPIPMEDKIETARQVDTGQSGYKPTDSKPQLATLSPIVRTMMTTLEIQRRIPLMGTMTTIPMIKRRNPMTTRSSTSLSTTRYSDSHIRIMMKYGKLGGQLKGKQERKRR